jgi:hypothetical protein
MSPRARSTGRTGCWLTSRRGKRLKQAAAAHAAELEPEEDQLRAELARLHAYDQDDDGRDGGADEGPALDRTG